MFELPKIDQRTSIVGHTGSGKTWLAVWLLGRMPIDQMPWVVVDYKRDDLLSKIKRVREIKTSAKMPDHAGVYILRPGPKVWGREGESTLSS